MPRPVRYFVLATRPHRQVHSPADHRRGRPWLISARRRDVHGSATRIGRFTPAIGVEGRRIFCKAPQFHDGASTGWRVANRVSPHAIDAFVSVSA